MKLVSVIIGLFVSVLVLWGFKNNERNYFKIQDTGLKKSMERGIAIYNDFCISCHLPSGEGVKHVYPPLAHSDYLKNNRIESIRAIKYGQEGKVIVNGKTYNNYMPPMGLEDDEIADVMNYINHSWGNDYGKIVTPQEVTKVSKK